MSDKTEEKKPEIPEIPEISKVSVQFNQEGNTLGTTSEYEQITISLEFQSGEDDGPFVTFKTEGWSINDISDLEELIKRTKKILTK